MNIYMHSDHMLFLTFASVLYRIYLAFHSSLYVRYNTAAHVVNSTYIYIYISYIYNMSGRVVSDIQTRAEDEWLYILYNTDAHVVYNL